MKAELKKNLVGLDVALSASRHVLKNGLVSAAAIGRTHCIAFVQEVIRNEHEDSVEVLANCSECYFYRGIPNELPGNDTEPTPSMIKELESKVLEVKVLESKEKCVKTSRSKAEIESEAAIETKLPQINSREFSADSRPRYVNSCDNPFKALLSFQKAKEEAKEIVKNFKLYENPKLSSKPYSEERLILIDTKKKSPTIGNIRSVERETAPNFFPAVPQPIYSQQQRIKDLEHLINRYDKKLSKYSEHTSPKVCNFKVSRRTGGGYIG